MHEYPYRDTAWIEDMGAVSVGLLFVASSFRTVRCMAVGMLLPSVRRSSLHVKRRVQAR
nr:DNA circularization N-terminal domain-containing protein [Klebsiella michiganensis]